MTAAGDHYRPLLRPPASTVRTQRQCAGPAYQRDEPLHSRNRCLQDSPEIMSLSQAVPASSDCPLSNTANATPMNACRLRIESIFPHVTHPRKAHFTCGFLPPKAAHFCMANVSASVGDRRPRDTQIIHPIPFGCRATAIAP